MPPGERPVVWKWLGTVGLLEARRRREVFAAQVHAGRGHMVRLDRSTALRRAASVAEVADDALRVCDELVAVDLLAKGTAAEYRSAIRHHVKPFFAGCRVAAVTPSDIAEWVVQQRTSGASP